MIKLNRICALSLAAALSLAPFTTALAAAGAGARAAAFQQDDVPSDAEQAMFTKGQNLYNQGRYDQAATVLQDFLKAYPRSIITDLTLLWLGRSYMQLGRLKDAETVGTRLRAIKDTPFADIYESELETARAEVGTRPVTPAGGTVTTRPAETARTTPGKPTARKVTEPANTTPTPTPTPSVARNNRPLTPIQPKQTPQTVAANANSSKAAVTPGTLRQANANTSTTPTEIAANTRPSRRSMRPGRRVSGPAVIIPPDAVAGQSTTRNAAAPASRPLTTTTNTSRNQQRPTTVASNNNTRVTQPTAPAVRPTPTPSNAATTTPVFTTPSRPAETSTYVPPPVTAPTETSAPQSGGLTVTVRQVPNLVLALRSSSEFAQPGQSIQMPLTIQNTGNKEDQFRLETNLPAEYQPSFSLAQSGAGTELPIFVTPQLARGSSIEVMLNMRVPVTASDGQQMRFTVSAASQADYQMTKVADGSLNIVAASLAAATNVSETSVMPGDSFTQTITVRNAGSSPARGTRADFVFNPNFELVSASPAPINYERDIRTAIWSLGDLGPRSSRDITVTLRAVPEALASNNPLGRGTVRTQSLSLGSNFDSPSVTVGKVPKARIDAVSIGLTTTPGDTIYVPFLVRNPGNAADSYDLIVTAPGAPSATVYADTNGDGQHQEGEPTITQTGQIQPRGGQFPLLLRVQIPASTPDLQKFSYNVVARSLLSGRAASEANTVLTVATPRVRVRTEETAESVAPGDSFFYRLVLVNEGSGLAKNLVVNETLPDALEFINSDPSLSTQDAPGGTQRFTWRVSELAPGDTIVLRVAVRLRSNLAAEQTLTTRHSLSYQDTNSNNYTGQ